MLTAILSGVGTTYNKPKLTKELINEMKAEWASFPDDALDIIGYDMTPNEKYIVFINSEFKVDYISDAAFFDQRKAAETWNGIIRLQAFDMEKAGTGALFQSRHLMGEALVACFDSNPRGAKDLLAIAASYIHEAGRSVAKSQRIIFGSINAVIVILIALALTGKLFTPENSQININESVSFSLLGACISGLFRKDSPMLHPFTLFPNLWPEFWMVLYRIALGCTTGIVFFYAYEADSILHDLINDSYSRFALMAIAAGFFERTVTAALTKFRWPEEEWNKQTP